MQDSERRIIEAVKAHQGGLGEPLTYEEQNEIYGGVKNERENFRPYHCCPAKRSCLTN